MARYIFVATQTIDLSHWRATATPKATHPLDGVKVKLRRANEHVENIVGIVDTFRRSNRICREMEPDGLHEVIKLAVAPIPEMLPAIIGEVAFHLRSVLDHLVYALHRDARFPFAGSRNEFELPATQRKIENLPPMVQKFICRLKPYKGGNNLLWAMNRLRNDNVHMRLVPLMLCGPVWGGDVTVHIPASNATVEVACVETFEDEIVLARCAHGAKLEYDAEPMTDIAFSNVEFLDGKGIVTGIREMVDLTERIFQIFERRFF